MKGYTCYDPKNPLINFSWTRNVKGHTTYGPRTPLINLSWTKNEKGHTSHGPKNPLRSVDPLFNRRQVNFTQPSGNFRPNNKLIWNEKVWLPVVLGQYIVLWFSEPHWFQWWKMINPEFSLTQSTQVIVFAIFTQNHQHHSENKDGSLPVVQNNMIVHDYQYTWLSVHFCFVFYVLLWSLQVLLLSLI